MKNELLVEFAHNLKDLRQKRGLNLRQLSDAVGIGRATLSEYERGITDPSLSAVKTIAAYFDVDINWLVGEVKSLGGG